ncbi:MAG: hypothetical protein Q8R43_01250, partial [Alphaproteobacteria bacterium]|nr:hypothetical protein [Alphaproteobacteria bacterium]
QKAAVTAISLKLATAFGANTLTLAAPTGFTNLTGADAFKIYRNGAAYSGAPVTVTYGVGVGKLTDSVVQIIDPTAGTVTDTAVAQQWLGYLTGVLNDAASGVTLDLSSIAIDDAPAVTAFNAAIVCLDSALSNKIAVLKLAVTLAADITLGTGSAGFSGLTRIEFTKLDINTVTFADALSVGRTYLTNLASVKMDTSTDWSRYLNYMLSTTAGGQSASSLNLNSRAFVDQTAVDAFFAGLHALSSKDALITLRMKLVNDLDAISIGGGTSAATGLAAGLRVIVDPGTSTETTHAGSGSNPDQVQTDNLIVLTETSAFSKGHIAYLAEQNGFAGTINLTDLALVFNDGEILTTALDALSADIKAKIKTINLQLQSGSFGGADLQLGALTEFTDLTINVDRNGAVDGADTYGALVVVANNTGHTVNLTDA